MNYAQIAKEIAVEAHLNQTRRGGGRYIDHPMRVADRVFKFGGRITPDPMQLEATAWLHDVLEDSRWTANALEVAGIPKVVVDAVVLLTRPAGYTYGGYIARLANDPLARRVKMADLLDNLSDAPTLSQIERYSRALGFLVQIEGNY